MNQMITNYRNWVLPILAGVIVLLILVVILVSESTRQTIGLATGTEIACESLDVSQPALGTISVSTDYDCYTFDSSVASSTQNIISIELTSKSGNSLDVDLYAPGEKIELDNTGYVWATAIGTDKVSKDVALDKGNGQYAFKVWSYSKGTGDYSFSFSPATSIVSSNTSPNNISDPLLSSQTDSECTLVESVSGLFEGIIDSDNKFDCYLIDAKENDSLKLELLSKDGSPLDIDLFSPGTPVGADNAGYQWLTSANAINSESLTLTLTKGSGKYALKAWSYGHAAQGKYELKVSLNSGSGTDGSSSVQSVTPTSCNSIQSQTPVSGSVSTDNKFDCFKYSPSSGEDTITVKLISDTGVPLDVDIFQPGSNAVSSGTGYDWLTTQDDNVISKYFDLPYGQGDYLLKVWSYGNSSTGSYNLEVVSSASDNDHIGSVSNQIPQVTAPTISSLPQQSTSTEVAVSQMPSNIKVPERPKPLTEAEKIVALFESPTNIDQTTGCGHRNYSEIGAGGGLMYPDGISRSSRSGLYVKGGRSWPYATKYEDRILYWNDWLGLSPDLKEAIEEHEKTRLLDKISDFGSDLLLSDQELAQKYASWNYDSAQEIRDSIQHAYDHWSGIKANTKVVFDGYPLLYPDGYKRTLNTTSQIDDVGYWDFAKSGENSVVGGYDWSFSSDVEGKEAYIHDGILDIPHIPAGEPGWGVMGSVELVPRELIDKSLDRQAFTLAFSFLPELFPTEMPTWGDDSTSFHEKHSPKRLIFSFGGYYRWMQVYVNEMCQMEVVLNYSPPGDYKEHKLVYLVSETGVDIRRWNEVQFTIDVPNKTASLTVIDGSDGPNKTDIFTLPDNFEWSFADWDQTPAWQSMPSVRYVDNKMGLFSGSGSGSFSGKLDWVYLANGIMDPIGVERRVGPLRGADVPVRKPAKIDVGPDGYVASAQLSPFDYPEWKVGAFNNSSMRNYLLKDVYANFEDAFDFIFLVQNEKDSDLDYAGIFRGVSNDIKGISEDEKPYDATKHTGSEGKLKAVTHFPTKDGLCCGPSLHEMMHRWGNYALNTGNLTTYTFRGNSEKSSDPLEQDYSYRHWGVSSVNGQLGGFDLKTLKELGEGWYTADSFGTYANGGNSVPFGNFELYLMGLIPPDEVEDIVLFKGIEATGENFYQNNTWYAEEKITVSIEDVINKLGPRVPDHNNSQKEFKVLTLVLTDDPLNESEWSEFSKQAKDFENKFAWATGNRASVKLGNLGSSLKSTSATTTTDLVAEVATSTESVSEVATTTESVAEVATTIETDINTSDINKVFSFEVTPGASSHNIVWDPEIGVHISNTVEGLASNRTVYNLGFSNPSNIFSVSLCSDKDCLDSGLVPVSGVTKNFIQENESLISFVPDVPLYGGRYYKVQIVADTLIVDGDQSGDFGVVVGISDWIFKTAEMTRFTLPLNLQYDDSFCLGGKQAASRYAANIGKPMCMDVNQVNDLVFGMEQNQMSHYFNTLSGGRFVISPVRDKEGKVIKTLQIDRGKEIGSGTCFRAAEKSGTKAFSDCPEVLPGPSIKDQISELVDLSRYANLKNEDGTPNLLAPYLPSREEALSSKHFHRNITVVYNYGTKENATLGAASPPRRSYDTEVTISNEEDHRTWAHEFGHAFFGLTDLYWHGGPRTYYAGRFDIMADNNGTLPPMSAWSLEVSELAIPDQPISDESMLSFLDDPTGPINSNCGNSSVPCALDSDLMKGNTFVKFPAIIERDTRKIKGHYLVQLFGSEGYDSEIVLKPSTVEFSDKKGGFPGGIAIWKVDGTEQKIRRDRCAAYGEWGMDNCNPTWLYNQGRHLSYIEFYPVIPTVNGGYGKSTAVYNLFPWWYEPKLPYVEDVVDELGRMPESIELPVLEIAPYPEVKDFGGGSKVATITLNFKDMVENLKQRITAAASSGDVAKFDTYKINGSYEFTIEVEKHESPVKMTYFDHVREGQKQFLHDGGLAEELDTYGYHFRFRE